MDLSNSTKNMVSDISQDGIVPEIPPEAEPDPQSDGDENENEATEEQREEYRRAQNIFQTGNVLTKNRDVTIETVTIIGQIEGHYALAPNNKATKYEHVLPMLVAAEENPQIDGLLVILNTVGGDVEAGLAIAEMIASMSKPTVSIVLGGGHSIGVPLAVCAKRTFIVPSATMTLHPVRINGLVLGVEQSFSYFAKMQDRITNFVCVNSKIARERLRELLYNTGEMATDIGTIVEGQEAVDVGMIDAVGGLKEALGALHEMVGERRKAAAVNSAVCASTL